MSTDAVHHRWSLRCLPSVQLENLTGAALERSYSPNRMYRGLRAVPDLLGLGTLNRDQVFS